MNPQAGFRTEADSIAEQALLGVEPVALNLGQHYAIRTPEGFKLVDLTTEAALKAAGLERLHPKSGYTFHNLGSFADYANSLFDDVNPSESFGREHALCLADESQKTIKLLFDSGPYAWNSISTSLQLSFSPEMQRWTADNGRYMVQQDFAEFCELNLASFHSPDAATILEIAQTFQAKTTIDFSSAFRLASGAIKLKHEEQINVTAGERAGIIIPEALTIAIPIFKYGKAYSVKARLRYRTVESSVKLSVLLVDPEMAIEHAFNEVVAEAADLLKMPVHHGST